MSRELFYQSLILKVVKGMGGQGFKLTNKFKSGIPDLFIKLPGQLALIAEVKFDTVKSLGASTTLDLTVLQEKFLRSYADVDMDVAAIKVAEQGNSVAVAITEPGYFYGWNVEKQDYGQPMHARWSVICNKKSREAAIWSLLQERHS